MERTFAAAKITELTIPAVDGFPLAATLYQPDVDSQNLVVINSAMGVKRTYYHKFAQCLADNGFNVLTYDYRSVGGSLSQPVKQMKTHLYEWGSKDFAGILAWLEENHSDKRIMMVGHSVGGQILGLTEKSSGIEKALFVACQSGYWRLWPGIFQAGMFVFWYIVVPGLSNLLGYFPASKIGMGEDLPAGVALGWSKAGRNRNYLLDIHANTEHDHYKSIRAAILSYSFSDDFYAPRLTVEKLLPLYPNTKSSHKHLTPEDIGAKAIGHFGFFREKFRDTLWQQVIEWLNNK